MTPTINVNLKRCDCRGTNITLRHADGACPGSPILLPCPIQRTVEMTVKLGECNDMPSCGLHEHHARCPARPIRVTCTIGGDGTWAGSEIAWTDVAEQECSALRTANARGHAERLVRDRWEIVKALLTESVVVTVGAWLPAAEQTRLIKQRDAVFSALAKMAQAEEAHLIALCDYLGSGLHEDVQVEVGHKTPPRQSPIALAAYVSHLIAKVCTL